MANYRAKLRCRQLACPELEVNSQRRQKSNEKGPKGIKRPKKAEVNYLPLLPFGETKDTLEKERVELLTEVKKKNNEKIVAEKMDKTFSYRRLQVVEDCPAVQDFIESWPALFSEHQIKEEFRRITTLHLKGTFLTKLDFYTPKLLKIFGKKGGVAGSTIKLMLDSFSEQNVEGRRDTIIRCLMEFLGESTEEVIKDYQDVSKDIVKDDYAGELMKIFVVRNSAAQGDANAGHVSIVIEETEVQDGCKSVSNACILLMGIIYAMNLVYPPKVKYTFEVFQKLFLELNSQKVSPKVQTLRFKLLA
ncbi:uncharacterized protein LOC117532895 [Gymnodraco acuticeps]|uniref:Uncharacterized protein LOC117532895 n=1 Tax=Gymnodraco acuticeps TaxID=8218 RepID=A0A6P8SQ01_GYMAC|nr:uncharacterized protein LOC117532895 [Gymnodraco acuticeps]